MATPCAREDAIHGQRPDQESRIPHEEAAAQKAIPFMGDELAAALTSGGNIYITLSGMCKALGLNLQAQFRRILRTATLAKGLRSIPLETRGGIQQVNCLRVDKVALWLAGIETSRVKLQFRTKIEAYQEELAPVATQIFLRTMGISVAQLVSTSAQPQANALAEQIDALTAVVNLLREHLSALLAVPSQMKGVSFQLTQAVALLESLIQRQDAAETQLARIDERTQRLTPAHARTIQELVDRMLRNTKHLPIPLTHTIIYGRLKHRFRAGSYREIADDRYDALLAYLHDELRSATSGEAPTQERLL